MISKLFSSVNLFKNGAISSRILVKFYSTGSDGEKYEKERVECQGQDVSSGDNKDGLVLGVYETEKKLELSPVAAEVDQKSGGKISRYLNEISSRLKPGKAFVVTDVVPEFGPVAISALGPKDAGYNELEALDEGRENVRVMVGAGVRALAARGVARVAVDGGGAPDAAAEAAHLAAWRFEEFKSDKQPEIQLSLYGGGGAGGGGGGGCEGEGEGGWDTGVVYGRAQNWARYLSDMPANKMTPVDFAQAALDTLCPLGVRVAAHERAWLAAQRMRALLAAAAGAAAPPLLLHCQYAPRAAAARPPVLLVAEGTTFDSGGLCLKSAEQMTREARDGLAGAAAALAALRVLAELEVPVPVMCVVPLCENMAGAACMKVGDVLPTLSGLHVLMEDTAAAARPALADALVFGQALHRPALVLGLSALAEERGRATAPGAFACFSNSAAAWRGVRAAGARAGDRPWRLPLWRCYARPLEDDPAVDLRNKGYGVASPCHGAAFLKKFICGEWVHMDPSGVARAPPGGYLRERRASGRPTRTLATFLADMARRRDANTESDATG